MISLDLSLSATPICLRPALTLTDEELMRFSEEGSGDDLRVIADRMERDDTAMTQVQFPVA